MADRFQFSVRNLLLASTLAAGWFALFAARDTIADWIRGNHLFVATYLYFPAFFVLPAATVGAICGRPLLGVPCGLSCYLAFIAIGS